MIDLRKFEYALQPLEKQREWQLAALMGKLGRLQQEINELADQQLRLREHQFVCSQEVMQQPGRQINPVMQFRNLNWLAKLQAEAHDLEARIDDLYRQYRAASKQCMDQQQRVDVIKQHRKECLAEFVSDESARLAGEQDRDWLARTHVEGKDSGADENRAAGENA